jgi:hypothetical protein
MTNTTKTCATGAAFNEDSIAEPSSCLNLVSFLISPGKSREPGPTDVCDYHQTHQEDAEQAAYIEANREAIMGGVMAMAATQELMGKLRRGSAQ